MRERGGEGWRNASGAAAAAAAASPASPSGSVPRADDAFSDARIPRRSNASPPGVDALGFLLFAGLGLSVRPVSASLLKIAAGTRDAGAGATSPAAIPAAFSALLVARTTALCANAARRTPRARASTATRSFSAAFAAAAAAAAAVSAHSSPILGAARATLAATDAADGDGRSGESRDSTRDGTLPRFVF